MDAVKFIEERKRLCEMYACCSECPARNNSNECKFGISSKEKATKQVELLEAWSAIHPIVTRADIFKKTHPNAPTHPNGALLLCPMYLDKDIKCLGGLYCWQCCKNYWLEGIQDGR